MITRSYTPQEAAAITELPLPVVQKAITAKQIPASLDPSRRRREINEAGVLALALTNRLPRGVRLSARQAYRLLTGAGIAGIDDLATFVTVGGSVRINLGETLRESVRRLHLVRRGRELVTRAPTVKDGSPVIKGTRITVDSLRSRVERGDTVDQIQTDHPVLDRDTIEAAVLWAQANPPRGRPKRRTASTQRPETPRLRDVSAWTRTMRITARQIDSSASGKDAQAAFPRLVRRLIHATGCATEASVPAGDSTSQPGWDGELVSTSETPWVPKGRSFLEMSCDARPTAKANGDYEKRTKKTPKAIRRISTFVLITGHRWPQKATWRDKRRKEGSWRAVRVYDAEDLEQWLEQSPAVALQFADELGLMGQGVESPVKAWEDWAEQSDPPISAQALFRDREGAQERFIGQVRERIEGRSSDALTLKADSVDEAAAFACAALLAHPDLSASALVVTDAIGWRFVEQNPLLKIVVAARPELADKPTRRAGLAVVIPYAADDMSDLYRGAAGRETTDLYLKRPHIHEFEKALTAMGVDAGAAKRLATSTGRSWSVLRRRRARHAAVREPAWLGTPQAEALSTVCLLGAWSTSQSADREVVAQVAGRPHEDVERDLMRLAQMDDSPVLQIGEVWKAKSPLELLDLFGDCITYDQLDRYFAVVREILTETDPELELPEEQRYAAQVYGKVRPQSELLIRALCDTLIKLAVRGPEVPRLAALDIESRIRALVRDLLHDCGAARWLSLASLLPSLAEAAPNAFLRAVEVSLERPDAPVTRLLTESSGSGIMGRCWHAGLLWALETLAWAPERLAWVSFLLARLCRIEIKGNWGKSPRNSLADIFRPWLPQTAATLEQRIAVVDALIQREPDIAFDLLHRLVHVGPDSATLIARPHWRDEDAGAGNGATGAERHGMLVAAADRLIACAGGHPRRIARLLEKIDVFDPPRIDKALALADTFTAPTASDEDRELIRTTLRRKIHWHRNYGTRKGRGFTRLKTIEGLYARLAPQDLVIRHRWLFADGWPELPGRVPDDDVPRALESLRLDALREISDACGMAGIDALAQSCPNFASVGVTLVKLNRPREELTEWIVTRGGDLSLRSPITMTVSGLLRATPAPESTALIDAILARGRVMGWDANQEARLLVLARDERITWDIAASRGSAVEDAHWASSTPGMWPRGEDSDLEYALRRLLAAGRPRTAFQVCHLDFNKVDPGLLVEMLERTVRGEEPTGPLASSWHLRKAIDLLEASDAIERGRLVRLEFGLIPALGHEGEQGAKSLYDSIMSNPALFTELLCLLYRPASAAPAEDISENSKAAARIAWQVLDHCRRQPGSRSDGSIDADVFVRFVDEARQLCREADRLAACEETLGRIMAYAPADADGVWPVEPARNVLDRSELEHMRRGFLVGTINKRGMSSRAYDEGGDQERVLAIEYRTHARALQGSHVNLAATLEELARSYENHGVREDLSAKLRVEGY